VRPARADAGAELQHPLLRRREGDQARGVLLHRPAQAALAAVDRGRRRHIAARTCAPAAAARAGAAAAAAGGRLRGGA
jgi:hypothetical protein